MPHTGINPTPRERMKASTVVETRHPSSINHAKRFPTPASKPAALVAANNDFDFEESPDGK
jgi:hypothetical protein